MRLYYTIAILIISFSTSFWADAQLYRATANGAGITAYLINNKPDSIFGYDIHNPKKVINASSHKGISSFKWAVYDASVPGYVDFKKDTGFYALVDTITVNNGYRVIISNPNGIDTFRCWAVIDDYRVEITSSINDTIKTGNIYCGYIDDLEAQIDTVKLFYYNPLTNIRIQYKNRYIPRWTSNYPNEARDPDNSVYNDLFMAKVTQPYWKDTWYIIEANDNFGLIRRDSAFYKSIQPHAEFKAEYKVLTDTQYYPYKKLDTVYKTFYGSRYNFKSAPAIYEFSNLSQHRDSCLWLFGDKMVVADTGKTVPHTYNLPGTYNAKLVAYKNVSYRADPCIDTFPKSDNLTPGIITVDDPRINNGTHAHPNVMVIGSDDPTLNTWRYYDDVSTTDIEITIYSRNGEKVHYYKGNIRDWEGWDGRRMGHNYVHTGVYYYVVKNLIMLPNYDPAKNNPDVPNVNAYDKHDTRNFIHVFNQND
jgi:hypothetical protein